MKKIALAAVMALHMAAFQAKASALGFYEKREDPSIKSVADAIDKIATAFDEYKKTNDARIEAIKSGNSTADLDAKLARMDQHIDAITEAKAKLEKIETRENAYYKRLEKQYGALDAKLAAFKATQTYLEQQIKLWTNQGND